MVPQAALPGAETFSAAPPTAAFQQLLSRLRKPGSGDAR
jgi:hypothetical protein